MRSARGFNKQVELWQTTSVPDGFGGNKVVTYMIAQLWAEVKTIDNIKASQALGLSYSVGNIKFTVRERSDINFNSKMLFIKYRGVEYTITSFPSDKDFVGAYISFIGVAAKKEEYNVYDPIDAAAKYSVYKARTGDTVENEACTLNKFDELCRI